MGQSLTHAFSTVSETSSSITKRLIITYNTTDGVTDSSNTFTVTEDFPTTSGAVNISVPFGGGTQDIYNQTKAFTKTYGSTGSKSFDASLTGINYWGSSAVITKSASTTIPARAYSAPAAPTSVVGTRVSATQQTVTWVNNSTGGSTTSAPYLSQSITRSTNGGSFTSLVTGLSGSATSYSDTTTVAGNSYAYKVVAVNTTASTTSAASNTLYSPPSATGTPTVTRVSDTQHTVSWTRNATTGAPYTSQSVQRRRNGGSWATIVTGLSGSATSYSDTTTAANGKYDYRVVATNSAGSATSAASSPVYTTPAPPTGASAAKDASGNIVITWTNACSFAEYESEIWESQDGGAYALLTTKSTGVATHTHVSPSTSVTHRYQVRAKTSSGTALYSTYSTTETVTLTAPPNAPTGLGPSTVHDATEHRTLVWSHNPTDSSPQRKFQVRHRASGDAWTEETAVTSATSSWVLAGATYANGIIPEWEVRTWGEATTGGSEGTGASVYSATASFTTSARPSATISAPADAGTLTDSTIAVAWTYYQAASSAQAQWRVTLLDSLAATLEVKTGAGTAASTTMATTAEDGETYTVQVEVQSAAGLWSLVDDSTFDVAYLPPSEVTAALVWDRDAGVVQITLTKETWDDVATIEPAAATVDRSSDSGVTWSRVATAVTLSEATAVVDKTVPTVADSLYRITAISALPSTFVGTPAEIAINETERAYLGYGPSFATILVFYANLSLGSNVGRAEVLEQFAGRVGSDGQPAGVLISGESRFRDVTVAASFLNSDGFARRIDFENAALAGGLMYHRDPSPRAMSCRMSGLNTSENISAFGDVAFNLSEAADV